MSIPRNIGMLTATHRVVVTRTSTSGAEGAFGYYASGEDAEAVAEHLRSRGERPTVELRRDWRYLAGRQTSQLTPEALAERTVS